MIWPGGLFQESFAHGPVFLQRFLRLCSVGNDALLVPFAAYAQDALFLLNVEQVQARKFADAQTSSVKQFKQRAIAPQKRAFFYVCGAARVL